MNIILIFVLLPKWSLFFLLTDIHSYYQIQEEVIVELDSAVFFNIFTRQLQLTRIKQLHFSAK